MAQVLAKVYHNVGDTTSALIERHRVGKLLHETKRFVESADALGSLLHDIRGNKDLEKVHELPRVLIDLAKATHAKGDPEAAKTFFEEGLGLMKAAVAAGKHNFPPECIAYTHQSMAMAMVPTDDDATVRRAARLLTIATQTLRELGAGAEENLLRKDKLRLNNEYLSTLVDLAVVQKGLREFEAAKENMRQAVSVAIKIWDRADERVADMLLVLGTLCKQTGDLKETMKHFFTAAQVLAAAHGDNHPQAVAARDQVALVKSLMAAVEEM